jgi:hypothetical protein
MARRPRIKRFVGVVKIENRCDGGRPLGWGRRSVFSCKNGSIGFWKETSTLAALVRHRGWCRWGFCLASNQEVRKVVYKCDANMWLRRCS